LEAAVNITPENPVSITPANNRLSKIGGSGKITDSGVGVGADISGNGMLILLFSSVNAKPMTVEGILIPSLTTVKTTSR